jgi:hypothetical protein
MVHSAIHRCEYQKSSSKIKGLADADMRNPQVFHPATPRTIPYGHSALP